MNQVLQSLRTGVTELADVPVPRATPRSIVVETHASVISPGTERMLVEFGRSGWIEKARSQPDKVRQVFAKVRTDGLVPTVNAVRAKLDDPIALGYCQAGVVAEVGAEVSSFATGDRVVTNGPHAEFVRVPQTLAAKIPAGVSFEAAAFAPLAAIGLQGFRLAAPTVGETVVVYGLGPIGLLTVQIARAAGCRAIGIDRDRERCAIAERLGVNTIIASEGVDVASATTELTDGVGADVVLLTLSTDSDEIVHNAAAMSRKRGRIVLIGIAGLNLRRDDFYKKELSFQVSCSYGPGRYDPLHEERGIDYPLPYVRWTEARNFSAVLDLMADGRLDPLPLITHRFPLEKAAAAYEQLTEKTDSLGVVLAYTPKDSAALDASRVVTLAPSRQASKAGVIGVIGAGGFASRVLIPAFKKAGATLEIIGSSGGVSAAVAAKKHEFSRASSDSGLVLGDERVDTVIVATRHDSHAAFAAAALDAGKNVFVEKPLALREEDLRSVAKSMRQSPGLLCVGFNRRFAPHTQLALSALRDRSGPAVISITVNAGRIPGDHWTKDEVSGGGRIVGEGCHFIDLARCFAGADISELQVLAGHAKTGEVIPDIVTIQMSFVDGSVAVIQYYSNGNKGFPKERVEIAFDEKVIRSNNFRSFESWGGALKSSLIPRAQDKGHDALVRAFMKSIRTAAPPPISYSELLETSYFSIQAERLARAGGGVVTRADFAAAFSTG